MGFECGFDSVKKYKNATALDVLAIDNYVHWRDNEWMREHYKTYFDYCKDCDEDYYKIPDIDIIEHFDTNREGDYGYIEKTIEFWCSSGRLFDSFITSHFKHCKASDSIYLVDEVFLDELSTWVEEQLNQNTLIPIHICRAYTDSDNKCKTLIDVAGVEVENEDGYRKFVDGNNDIIYVASSGFNSEDNYTLTKLKTTIELMRELINDNIIWYYRSE